jgi:hypothetical protein
LRSFEHRPVLFEFPVADRMLAIPLTSFEITTFAIYVGDTNVPSWRINGLEGFLVHAAPSSLAAIVKNKLSTVI